MYLMVWDIDDFKQVNDTYGHYFGDEVIKHLATELNRAVANRGLVGRIGGTVKGSKWRRYLKKSVKGGPQKAESGADTGKAGL